jgi:polyhydroxyalkanoate synthesis repressor PhaR
MSEPRVIKRYANRKLYDTKSSQYVTLDQIAQMIRTGEEVRVLDNSTKDDLTSVTLAQIIFEEEKRQKSFIPLQAMRHLIQSGGASLQELAQQAQARVLSVFRKGEGEGPRTAEEEAALAAAGGLEARDLAEVGHQGETREVKEGREARRLGTTAVSGEASHNAVREFLDRSQLTIEEWQRRADERIRQLLEGISPFSALEKEVARLTARVEQLEQHLLTIDHPPATHRPSDEN